MSLAQTLGAKSQKTLGFWDEGTEPRLAGNIGNKGCSKIICEFRLEI